MKFTVTNVHEQVLGTIDVTEEAFNDDDSLLCVLADAGHLEVGEAFEVVEDDHNRVEIFEYESGTHVVSLTLIH